MILIGFLNSLDTNMCVCHLLNYALKNYKFNSVFQNAILCSKCNRGARCFRFAMDMEVMLRQVIASHLPLLYNNCDACKSMDLDNSFSAMIITHHQKHVSIILQVCW